MLFLKAGCIRLISGYYKVVNIPDFSTHNMIADRKGDVWVAEPG